MRLNLFLPYSKRSAQKGAGGLLRRLLRSIGPTWNSSPFRRIIQTVFFLGFLYLFFYVCWPYNVQNQDYAASMARKERIQAESFLALDPLVSISTAIAAHMWVWSLTWAGAILLICILVPRGFCGYLCPLGTPIDLFDWAMGKRVRRFNVQPDGWWVNLRYYLLLGVLVSSMFGVLLSGFVAAIPLITRGMQFILSPLQLGSMKGSHLIPPINAGHFLSIVLFLVVLGLGFLRPRFWCRYLCPTGAMFSVGNLLRVSQRKVEATCIACDKCMQICPFDAIKADYTTRTANCTLCQTCGGVCPTHSIKFVDRWNILNLKQENDPPTHEIPLSRRGFLSGAALGALAAGAVDLGFGAITAKAHPVVRPPGSVPEEDFLALCIRCGECFAACPNNVLQPMGFEGGLNSLWTPKVVPNWSGCEVTCTNCGQVCPTGAIRALPIEEKRVARMGLAIVNEKTCLPYSGREACDLCRFECQQAGYNAIEFRRVAVVVDQQGLPAEDSGFLVSKILPELCVGCGLCQTRCYGINVKTRKVLKQSAIVVHAGQGNKDRLWRGSYLTLRQREKQQRLKRQSPTAPADSYLPDFLK